jgi:exopolyphosphatase/guanosine-5'-triphosphate,3'-diphosphate pyrophosphatase
VLSDQTWLVRLGQDVNRTRRFHPEALMRARLALSEAAAQIAKIGRVERILAVATSAARDVENQDELLTICSELKIPVQIISGDLEAQLTFGGATQNLPEARGCAVIDVGGGSTEIILQSPTQGLQFQSVDVGSVRITEQFFSHYPIASEELANARAFVRQQFERVQINRHEIDQVVAVAGTPTTIAAIDLEIAFDASQVEGHPLRLQRLDHWLQIFAEATPEQIVMRYHIESKRADVIAAGTLVLSEAVKYLKVTEFKVSTKGVRYGVAVALERKQI